MTRKLKKIGGILLTLFFLWQALCPTVYAEVFSEDASPNNQLTNFVREKLDQLWEDELSQSVPEETQELMEENGFSGLASLLSMTPSQLFGLLKKIAAEKVAEPLSAIGRLMGTILLCAVLNAVQQSGISQKLQDVFTVTAAACVVSFLSEPILGCITQTVQTLQECSLFMMSFTPVMSGILIAGGNPASAGAYHVVLFFVTEILAELAAQTLIPLLGIYLALCIVAPLAPFLHLDKVTSGIKSAVCWGLGILTTLFVGMLSLQTVIGAGGDSLMLKTSKFLVGSFIPVIGSTISDALGAAKGCVQVLKSAVGSFGIVVAVLTFFPVLLRVGLWQLAVNLSAWIASMLDAGEIPKILSCISQTFSILIAMIVCFMLLTLVSTTFMLMITVG